MEFSVIPCVPGAHAATLWFGVTAKKPPGEVRLRVRGVVHVLPARSWIPLEVPSLNLDSRRSETPFWYFRHRLTSLAGDTVHHVHAELAGQSRSMAVFRTLPTRLPPTLHTHEDSHAIRLGLLVWDESHSTLYRLRVLGDSYDQQDQATVSFDDMPVPASP